MNKILLFVFASLLFASCGGSSDRGELVGVKRDKMWRPERPYGMVDISSGAFTMGNASYDPVGSKEAPSKTVSVSGFYMDETEISNNEYREFVYYVRDSVLRECLAQAAEYSGEGEDGDGIGRFAYKRDEEESEDGSEVSKVDILREMPGYNPLFDGIAERLNWEEELPPLSSIGVDGGEMGEAVRDKELFTVRPSGGASLSAKFDTEKMVFTYYYFDEAKAARRGSDAQEMLVIDTIGVYPDTTVWVRDFTYAYNTPIHNHYFYHAAFDNYPVVGVNWSQARAFCSWRTMKKNNYQKEKGNHLVTDFRLPSEAEWEYAARGGLDFSPYPWGGPYLSDDRGCFLANYKPLRGDYSADGELYTMEVDSFEPNGYGLYNMAGNVSEWTNSTYDPSSYYFVSTMNPNYVDSDNLRKVVRGGSWKDVAYYLQVGVRDFEYRDSSRSYIGFRTVQDQMGTNVN